MMSRVFPIYIYIYIYIYLNSIKFRYTYLDINKIKKLNICNLHKSLYYYNIRPIYNSHMFKTLKGSFLSNSLIS